MGHIELSHGIAQMKTKAFTSSLSGAGKQALADFGGAGGALSSQLLSSIEGPLFDLVNKGYSRTNEYEADAHIEADKTENLPQQPKDNITKETIKTLESFVIQKNNLQTEIEELKKKITKTILSSEKKELNSQLSKLKETLKNTQKHLSEIAAGIDISSLSEQKVEVFEFQKEVLALIKPIVDEVKDMTSDMRLKSALKDKILYYNSRIPTIEAAITNLKLIKQQTENNRINLELELTQANWEKQRSFMLSEQQAAQLQLNKVLLAENNAKISSVSWFKSFFQKRGLYLSEAIVVIIMVIILSKLSYSAMQRFLPGFKAKHRSFKIRLLELIHRILTIVFIIIGPMVVFYLVEDWVLFSLGPYY